MSTLHRTGAPAAAPGVGIRRQNKTTDAEVSPLRIPEHAPEARALAELVTARLAAAELAGWIETAYLLRSPNNAKRLLEASQRAAAGDGETLDMTDLLERFGLASG